MSILLNASSRVAILGITGGYASRQTREMIAAGTKVVGGVSTGRAGEQVHGVPVFDTFAELMRETPADAVALHVNPSGVLDALIETVEAGIKLIYAGTEGVPPHDAMYMRAFARRHDAWLIGPNSLGLITPGEALLGGLPDEWCKKGRLGVFSRSGTLCLFVTSYLTKAGIGQSTVCTIGGDQIIGRNPVEYLRAFEEDPETDGVLMLDRKSTRLNSSHHG
jgi:succinyl-CoA synthetase alpha subunit